MRHDTSNPSAHDDHPFDGGLVEDLQHLARRRRALRTLGLGAGLALSGAARAACSLIPTETAGPYPGDGSNTSGGSLANALMLSGIVRPDIRTSVDGGTGTAGGVPLTMRLQLVNTSDSCARLDGYAIYLWHCTREGGYSMYSAAVQDENFLRGVQETDERGIVTFQTIFPGCYAGRMPHMHFEVYRSLTTATSYTNKLRTSQIAFPRAVCEQVYAQAEGYTASQANLRNITFETDNVFRDGVETQLATVKRLSATTLGAGLRVGIAV